jgi:hypothetical protein
VGIALAAGMLEGHDHDLPRLDKRFPNGGVEPHVRAHHGEGAEPDPIEPDDE